jgi:hypothetical protein
MLPRFGGCHLFSVEASRRAPSQVARQEYRAAAQTGMELHVLVRLPGNPGPSADSGLQVAVEGEIEQRELGPGGGPGRKQNERRQSKTGQSNEFATKRDHWLRRHQ